LGDERDEKMRIMLDNVVDVQQRSVETNARPAWTRRRLIPVKNLLFLVAAAAAARKQADLFQST
jgi:hypothetical protein